MDPATAFGIASGVVQFISFASNLMKGVIEIRESGCVKSVKQLSDITDSLQQWNKTLNSGTRDGHIDAGLAATLEGCGEVAIQMAHSLQKVRGNSKARDPLHSFHVSVKSAWGASEREQLQKQLNNYRLEICTYLVVLLFSRGFDAQQTSFYKKNFPGLPVQVPIIESQLPPSQCSEWLPILKAAYGQEERRTSKKPVPRVLQIVQDTDPTTARAIEEAVLDTIEFAEISHRHDTVEWAHQKTFEWIFEEPRGHEATFSSFSKWLLSDQALYWVTGKAGSGKSTLIKFLRSDPRTISIARQRMPEKKLILASFFFWNAGKGLQISRDGLIRTLLYDCLSQGRELISQIAPRRWDMSRLFGQDDKAWEWAEMVACLHAFFDLTKETHSVLLLIDGLDEFVGEHAELISLVQTFSQWQHIKTCVSSRPWMVFEDAYKQKPSLRMEHLTVSDIHRYVSDKLSGNQGFLDLQQAEPKYASQLIGEITTRASGVFLWVVLVTRELMKGLLQGDRLRDLERRLHALPTDLEALFRKMLNFQDRQLFENASRIIQLVELPKTFNKLQRYIGGSLIDLAFADEDQSQVFAYVIGELPMDRKIGMANRMRRRVDHACKGLIEVQRSAYLPDAQFDYLHRTVKDFLLRDDIWLQVLEATPKDFNLSASWYQVALMRLKTSPDCTYRDVYQTCFWIKNAELTGYGSCRTLVEEWEGTVHRLPMKPSEKELIHYATMNQLAFYVQDKLNSDLTDPYGLKNLWLYALCPSLRTPIPKLFQYCRAEMAEILLQYGANPKWTDEDGKTIWEARNVDSGHINAMEAMLRQFMAQQPKSSQLEAQRSKTSQLEYQQLKSEQLWRLWKQQFDIQTPRLEDLQSIIMPSENEMSGRRLGGMATLPSWPTEFKSPQRETKPSWKSITNLFRRHKGSK